MNLTAIQYGYSRNISPFRGQKVNMQEEDKLSECHNNAIKELRAKVQSEVPQTGDFKDVIVRYDAPYSYNVAYYSVISDKLEPINSRRLLVSAARKGTDRLTSTYLTKGNKKEIIEYLDNPKNCLKIKEAVSEVLKSTDDHYSFY